MAWSTASQNGTFSGTDKLSSGRGHGVGPARTRLAALGFAVMMASSLGGCADAPNNALKNVGDYLNLRNSFLNPAEVGRFDKEHPWAEVKPIKWPILDQLDLVDEPSTQWSSATDPTPADLVPELKEYVLATGDTINVSIFELVQPGADFVQQRRINESGYINLQNLGPVLVSGLTPTQLEAKIGQILVERRILPPEGTNQLGPQVNVTVADSRQRVFSFLGTIGRPGTYNVLSADFRLLDAIALAGDIPVQPGMDYLYVIRQVPYDQKPAGGSSNTPPAVSPASSPATHANPLNALEQIQQGSETQPAAPKKAPATGPQSRGDSPILLRPLPTAVVLNSPGSSGGLAAGGAPDPLDAALGVPSATTPATAPAKTDGPVPVAAPAAPAAAAPAANPDQKLLESAVAPPTHASGTRYVFIDGRWVPIATSPPSTTPSGAAAGVPTTNEMSVALPSDKLVQQRIIRIPIVSLRQGAAKYNIVVRPGDIINIPAVEPGEFYMMGNIGRPGVYSLTGRKVTLKMAVAAAGNLGAQAIPRRCDLIRRVGTDQEVTVQVNLQKIFDGEQPDIFMKANDVVNIGTDLLAPFLLITRNAYRGSYGWGFVYDRNIGQSNGSSGSSGF